MLAKIGTKLHNCVKRGFKKKTLRNPFGVERRCLKMGFKNFKDSPRIFSEELYQDLFGVLARMLHH